MAALTKVEYGVPTDKCAIAVRLGIRKGFFRDEGLDLSVRIVFGGPPLAAAYNRGDLMIGEIGSPPAINALGRAAKFRIIGSGMRRQAHMYLGVPRHITDLQQLKGKRLGLLSIGSCPEWFVRKMCIVEGLDPDRDLIFVPLLEEYPRVIQVMEEGRIDACLAVEPNLSIGERQGLLKVWGAVYDQKYLPHFQWMVLVANTELLERDPALVQAVLRAYVRSAHYAAAHVDELVEMTALHNRIDLGTARRAVERELPHFHLDGQIDRAGLAEVIRLQLMLRGIERPLDAESILELSHLPPVPKAA